MRHIGEKMIPAGFEPSVTAVKGRCLSLSTTGPYVSGEIPGAKEFSV